MYAAKLSNPIVVKGDDDVIKHFQKPIIDIEKLALVVLVPRFHMPQMVTSIFSAEQISELESKGSFPWHTQRGELVVTKEDAEVVLQNMDMSAITQSIHPNVPILLLHGTDDELIPCSDSLSYKETRPSIDLVVVEGARHAFRGKKQNKVVLTSISQWLGEKKNSLSIE